MCGRFVSKTTPQQLADYFSVDELAAGEPDQSYNVAPTNSVMALAERADTRTLETYHWGLIPSWAKDRKIGSRMINARSETVAGKPAYRRAFARRRCIIPADGFYEWRALPGEKTKQPYFIRFRDGSPLAFAGLWELWDDPDDPDGSPLKSCTIITGPPNELVAKIHDRMPVVLPRERWDEWLDPGNDDTEALGQLLVAAPAEMFEAYPVSTRVNKPQHKGPENVEPDPQGVPLD